MHQLSNRVTGTDAGAQLPPGARATLLYVDCVTVRRRCVDRLSMPVFGVHVNGYFAWLRALPPVFPSGEAASLVATPRKIFVSMRLEASVRPPDVRGYPPLQR